MSEILFASLIAFLVTVFVYFLLDYQYKLRNGVWVKIQDEGTLPTPPCLGFWSDGKYTVLDSQNDCEYAVNLIAGKCITHWMPLPDAPRKKNVEEKTTRNKVGGCV